MPAVKIGVSRQVVIPKKLHDELGLTPGDYLEVELDKGKLVLTPKTLVDKRIGQGIRESFEDFRRGRTHGPFDSAKEATRFLHAEVKGRRSKKPKAS